MSEKYTFSRLMSEYVIRIPIIQRDYVQGRKSEYGVRSGFLAVIHQHLVNDLPMSLDFVYGKEIKAKDGGRDVFVPLDGQQRLTTLLLLSWYFGLHPEKTLENKEGWVFQYASRRMAMSFIQMLLSSHGYDRKSKPSDWVLQQGFVPAWAKDPTVASMLRMLDDIYEKFRVDMSVSVDMDNIGFYIHPCDNISEDETYLKINARGEPLTEWENIKSILDARAARLVKSQNEDLGDSARKWQEKINGDWIEWVESLLRKDGGRSVPDDSLEYYIALSVSAVSAAFRNVIDAAGMLSVSTAKLAAKYKALETTDAELGEVMLGSRLGAKSVRDVEELGKYYVSAFMRHEATYEDYRDESVFTDEAFVRTVRFLDALDPKGSGLVFSGWSWNRSKNGLWRSLMGKEMANDDHIGFLKEFLFADVHLNVKSLEQREQGDFEKWCKNQDDLVFSRNAYTYHSVLRFALLSEAGKSIFATTRALNILDFWKTDEVNAGTLLSRYAILSRVRDDGCMTQVLTDLKECGNFGKAWQNFVENEKVKADHWERGKIDFLHVETGLSSLAGLCSFAYDPQSDSFNEEVVELFARRFMRNDCPVDDPGFCELIAYFPDSPNQLILPDFAEFGRSRYHAWKRFLLQPEIERAIYCYLQDVGRHVNIEIPPESWKANYKEFIFHLHHPYAMLSRWGCGFDGGVYVYNQRTRMTNGCYQLSYDSEQVVKLLKMVSNGGNPFRWHGQAWLPLGGAKRRTEVSVGVLSSLHEGTVRFRVFDDEGRPLEYDYKKDYKTFEELLDCVESLRNGEWR